MMFAGKPVRLLVDRASIGPREHRGGNTAWQHRINTETAAQLASRWQQAAPPSHSSFSSSSKHDQKIQSARQ